MLVVNKYKCYATLFLLQNMLSRRKTKTDRFDCVPKKGTLANCSANLPKSAAADSLCCWWCLERGSTSTPPCTPLFPFTSILTDEIGLFLGSLFPTADTSLRECQINITILTYSTMEQEVVRSWKQASSPGKGYIIPWSDRADCSLQC